MQLTTDRLLIRSFTSDDSSAYAELVRDPEVMRYLGEPLDAAAAAAYVADCVLRDRSTGVSRYAVLHKADEKFLGFCGFKALDEDSGRQVPAGEQWVDFGWRYRRDV